MKKQYSAPVLEEYGCLTDLTLGAGGTQPDFVLGGAADLTLVNNNCDAVGAGNGVPRDRCSELTPSRVAPSSERGGEVAVQPPRHHVLPSFPADVEGSGQVGWSSLADARSNKSHQIASSVTLARRRRRKSAPDDDRRLPVLLVRRLRSYDRALV